MMLYRALVLGMLVAIAGLLVTLPDRIDGHRRTARYASSAIVHVSAAAVAQSPEPFPETLATIVGLGPDEWIIAVEGELRPHRAVSVAITNGRAFREVFVAVQP